jgi:hypothetical protein
MSRQESQKSRDFAISPVICGACRLEYVPNKMQANNRPTNKTQTLSLKLNERDKPKQIEKRKIKQTFKIMKEN